jgi:hypothetical protein
MFFDMLVVLDLGWICIAFFGGGICVVLYMCLVIYTISWKVTLVSCFWCFRAKQLFFHFDQVELTLAFCQVVNH